MILFEQLQCFLDFVAAHDVFIIAGHREPDGDCISSCLVLSELVRGYGKKTIAVSAGPFKRPEVKPYEVLFKKTPHDAKCFFEESTTGKKVALFIVDCSAVDRLGDIEQYVKDLPTFVIDHHKTASFDAANSLIDASAPATAYLIQQLYEQTAGSIPPDCAKLLFFGLATDTGFFRFLDTNSADFFHAAARLVALGANPRQVYTDMTGGKSFSSRKLLGVLLERTKLYCNGHLALTYETLEDTNCFGLEGRDSDGLYQLLLAVENVCAIAVIRQESETNCTIGLRSKENIDVSIIAASYGGGGHKNAAGLTVATTIEKFIPILLQDFQNILL